MRASLVAALVCTFISANVFAGTSMPSSFTYQGRLMNSAGNAPLAANLTLYLEITNPSGTCLLYSEHQNVNTTLTAGLFTIRIGEGTLTSSVPGYDNDPGYEFSEIFTNKNSFPSVAGSCPGGWTPGATDARVLKVYVWDGSTTTTLADQTLTPVPQASVADTIDGVPLQGLTLNWTDATRPANPVMNITHGFNRDQNRFEKWNGGAWVPTTPKFASTAIGDPNVEGVVMKWNDTNNEWEPSTIDSLLPQLDGDVEGDIDANTVVALQNRPVSNTAPNPGEVLKWNGGAWAPSVDGGVVNGTTDGDILRWNGTTSEWEVAAGVNVDPTGFITLPGAPTANDHAATKDYVDTALSAIDGLPAMTDAQIVVASGTTPTAVSMSGDATIANTGAVTVTRIQNQPVAVTAPSANDQVLMWNGSAWTPTAVSSAVGTGTQNYLPKWNNAGGTTLGNSAISDNGTLVQINSPASINGPLVLQEQGSDPAATTGYGKIYVKTDNTVWYMDEAGTPSQFVFGSGAGEVNTGSSLGGDADVFEGKSGVDLRFRGISAGSNITVTENATDIEIGTTGLQTALTAGTATTNVLRWDGDSWEPANLVAADIPDLSATYVTLTGAQTITGVKTFSGGVTGLPAPVANSDAATKQYVDTAVDALSDVTDGTTAGQTLRWDGNSWEPMSTIFVDGSERVGIGTAPGAKLDVAGEVRVGAPSANQDSSLSMNSDGSAHYNFVNFQNSGAVYGFLQGSKNFGMIYTFDNHVFRNASSVEHMRIASDGKVGIGTDTPNEKLTLDGVLSLRESAAPTGTADYGKLYVKSDNNLYYMTEGGVENQIPFGSGVGEVNTGSSLGGDQAVFAGKSGVDLQFKGLTAGSNITLTPTANDITIAATGIPASGTTTNNTMRWSGTAWVETDGIQITSGGDVILKNAPTANDHATTKAYVDNAVNDVAISGGTQNYVTKFNATGDNVVNSQIFDNGTNVGIGTTSPNADLHLYKSSNPVFRISALNGSNITFDMFENHTAGSEVGFRQFYDGGSNRFEIKSFLSGVSTTRLAILRDTGNVGIGTTTPVASLHINKVATTGTIASTGTAVAGTGTNFTTAFSVGDRIIANGESKTIATITNNTNLTVDTGFASDLTAGTSYARVGTVLASGNVGIGTSTPRDLLEVFSSSGGNRTTAARLVNGSSVANSAVSLDFNVSSISGITGRITNELQSTGNSRDLVFSTYNGTLNESMRITGARDVGIGTATPNEKLTLDGVLSLKESAAPTATADYGKLYVKPDNNLYYMTEGGVENQIPFGSGVGEVNTGSSLGGTADVFEGKSGVDLRFRGISGGTNITVTENANDITIAATGIPASGTTTNNTMRWSGTAWVETDGAQITTGGDVILKNAPTANMHAATKQYVDTAVSNLSAVTDITGGDAITATETLGVYDIDVNVDNTTIEINSDQLRIKDGGIGLAKLAAGTTKGQTMQWSGTAWQLSNAVVPGNNEVLTWDTSLNAGNGGWKAAALPAGVSISGTQNVIPKFNAAGTNIENSSMTDNGTYVLMENPPVMRDAQIYMTRNGSDLLFAHTTDTDTAATQSTFVGFSSGNTSATGGDNSAFGYRSLGAVSSGAGNVAMGRSAGEKITTGSSNIAIGVNSAMNLLDGSNNIAINSRQSTNVSGTHNISMGSTSLDASNGTGSVAIGSFALERFTGGAATAIGYGAARNNSSGTSNVAVGYNSQLGVNGSTTGSGNVSMGNSSLLGITTGSNNIAVGTNSLNTNTTGSSNTTLGHRGLYSNDTGSHNVALGYDALYSVNNSNNIAVGSRAGFNASSATTGAVFIGHNSGPTTSTDVSNKLYIDNQANGNNTPLIYGDFSTDSLTINGDLNLSMAGKYFKYMPNAVECADEGVLKWDATNDRWICGTDAGASGTVASIEGATGTVDLQNGTTGTAPSWAQSGSNVTLHIPMASTASVTAGLLSKTDYDRIPANGSTTNNTMRWSGTAWVQTDGAQITSGGDVILKNAPTANMHAATKQYVDTAVGAITGLPAGAAKGQTMQWSGTAWQLSDSTVPTNNQVLTWDTSLNAGNGGWKAAALPAGVSISGTQNYLAKFNAAGTNVENSVIFEDGGDVGIGTATPRVINAVDTMGLYRVLNVDGGALPSVVAVSGSGDAGVIMLDTTASADQKAWSLASSQGLFSIYSWDDSLTTTSRMTIAPTGNVGFGTMNPNSKVTVEGVLSLRESAAPTATANYGKLYVKNDNNLYYMTEGGVENQIPFGTGVGEVNTGSSLGGDQAVFAGKSGVNLQFKGLTAGSNITLTPTANDITIAATGIPAAGSTTNNTMRWSGTAWVQTDGAQITAGGDVILKNAPTANMHAATKQYVDTAVGAIAGLPAMTNAQIVVANGTTPTAVSMSGDTTIATSGAVTIANNAVTTGKINDGAVTLAKLANGAGKGQVMQWSGTAWQLSDATVPTNNQVLTWDTSLNAGNGGWKAATPSASGVTGTGTQYSIPMWNNAGGTAIGNSLLAQNSTAANRSLTLDGIRVLSNRGTDNVFVGNSGNNTFTTGSATYNTAMGSGALDALTTGQSNNAIGYNALTSLTTGYYNNAFGAEALYTNTIGNGNTAIGNGAMRTNLSGSHNTALGYSSLYANTTGEYNVGIGVSALQSNTTGTANIGIGTQTLYFNSTGTSNVAIGHMAMEDNTGSSNVAIGSTALPNATGNSNISIGSGSGYNATGASADNIFIGTSSGPATTGTVTGKLYINHGNGDDTPLIYGDFVDNLVRINNIFELPEIAAPTTPASGYGRFYVKADGRPYFKNDGGTEFDLAETGSGGLTSLNSLTASTQTFAIGTAGNSPAWSSVTSTHTLNIPMASTASVTAGLLSKTDYDRIPANGSTTNNTMRWSGTAWVQTDGAQITAGGDVILKNAPTANMHAATKQYVDTAVGAITGLPAMTNAQIVVANGTTPTAVSMSGDTTIATSGAVTIADNAVTTGKINDGAVTLAKLANGAGKGQVMQWSGTAWQLSDATVPTNNQVLTWDTSLNAGNGGWKAATPSAGGVTGTGNQYRITMWNNAGGTTIGNSLLGQNSTAANREITLDGIRALSNRGTNNTFVGNAGNNTFTTGSATDNVGIGISALSGLTTGQYNVAIGASALQSNTSGAKNTAIGLQSLSVNTGSSNTAIGANSLLQNTTGNYNIAIGEEAVRSNTTGLSNVGIGTAALYGVTTGTGNVALGDGAGMNITGASTGNLILGFQSGPLTSGAVSNKLYINNSYDDTPLIYGDFTDNYVRINNIFELPEIAAPATPDSGYGRFYVKSDGKPYFKNDGGTEYDLSGGGGGGVPNGSATGQILRWDGSAWVAVSMTNGQVVVGHNTNGASVVSMGGDATISNTGSVTIANNAVTTAKINGNAVTTAKIADGTILFEDIAANSCTANQIIGRNSGNTAWECKAAPSSGITSLGGLTGATQTFAIGTAGNSPAWSSVTSTHTLNIPLASASGSVTAGLISNAHYTRIPASVGSANQTLRSDGTNWVSNANLTVTSSGDVTAAGTLKTQKAITGADAVEDNAAEIDFDTSNLQYTTRSCGSFTLWNMKNGGSYTLAVQGTSSATCDFTAYSGAGSGSLTVRLPPAHGATESGKHTIYTFIVLNNVVYASWIPGY